MSRGFEFQQQIHGYQSGHGLLGGTIKLGREDQDLVDRLSDIAGPIRPSEAFDPYLTLYPLPSEEYFVVARTWQDQDVPRAGCVLTRSAFIPMADWGSDANVLGIVQALSKPDRAQRTDVLNVDPLRLDPETTRFPSAEDLRLPELVEALFLESRRPIVMFGLENAEVIDLRIVSALWPSRRRSFASCTWCLGPRKLKGRDFDLVFAPTDARGRFSDWNGRRIEVAAKPNPGRHRWTPDLVAAIFLEQEPTLTSWDELGILADDRVGDEGALRLSLMWRELEGKVRTTPNAVLGMLDILNSHSIDPAVARAHLEPAVTQAVDLATASLPPGESWRFFSNLLGKFPKKLPSSRTLRRLKHASNTLARSQPASAVTALRDLHDQGKPIPAILAAGMGDGLSAAGDFDDLVSMGPYEMLRLVAYSRRFSARLGALVRDDPSVWTPSIVAALQTPDRELAKRARRNLLPAIKAPEQAPLLWALLDGLSSAELGSVARTLGKTTDYRVVAFDEPLIAAAHREGAVSQLREAVLGFEESAAADRLLARSTRLDAHDFHWLRDSLPRKRGLAILLDCLRRNDDGAVQMFLQDAAVASGALSWLLDSPHENSDQVARLLRLGRFPPDQFVDAGLRVRGEIGPTDGHRLDLELLRRALAESSPDQTDLAAKVLAETSPQVDATELVLSLTPVQASSRRIMANIAAVSASAGVVRRPVLARIDQFTNRLINRGTADFDEKTYIHWATLIEQSPSVAPQAHLNACIDALAYALRQTRAPLSALVLVTFPTAYKQLLAQKSGSDFGLIPTLMLLPFTLLADWDRPKTARGELVDAFMTSSWPPANLLLTAVGAGIDQKVLGQLSRSKAGTRYIDRIAEDAGRLSDGSRRAIHSAISRFFEDPRMEA